MSKHTTKWDVSMPASGDIFERRQRIGVLYDSGDWHATYQEGQATVVAHPWNVDARINEAALLGDWGEMYTGLERAKRKQAALRKLRYWVRTPPLRLPPSILGHARNELYYHGGDWKRQALLGFEDLRNGQPRALYSVGVGAACYGAELMRLGHVARARRWAAIGVKAWYDYYKLPQKRDRWDTHTFKAIGLAVLGEFDEADRELKIVQGLIGKDIRSTCIYDVETRLRWCQRQSRG